MNAAEQFRKNIIANGLSQVFSLGLQPLIVLCFAHFWGFERYGTWLMLFAIPQYLALSDLGIGYYLSASVPQACSKGNWRRGMLELNYGLTILLLLILFVSLILAAVVAVGTLCTDKLDALQAIPMWLPILVCLLLHTACSQILYLVGVAHRAHGRYHLFTNICTAFRLAEALASLLAAVTRMSFIWFAVLLFALHLANMLWVIADASRSWSRYRIQLRLPPWKFVRRIAKPTLAYVLFPAGNVIMIQAPIMILGAVLGPAVSGQFNVVRQVPRLITVATSVITNAVQPAIALEFGTRRDSVLNLVRRAHRSVLLVTFGGTAACLVANLIPFVNTYVFGSVGGLLLLAFMVPVLVDSLWSARAASLYASNHHEAVALVFCLACVLTIPLALLLAKPLGLYVVAVAATFVSLCMTAIVQREYRRHVLSTS